MRGGFLVKGATTAVNLGITLNSKLSWKDHVSKAKEKAIKNLGALSSIPGSTWGGDYHSLQKIFKAVIVPQLAYGASIWYTPIGKKGNQKTLVTQLVQIQAVGARLITGAFKANSTQAFNIEAHLTPINLKLDKKITHTAARLFSGPLSFCSWWRQSFLSCRNFFYSLRLASLRCCGAEPDDLGSC